MSIEPPASDPSSPARVQALGALAHPTRSRLWASLRTGGPATATDLAVALGTNTGATSYHLRQLAQWGLVVDTGQGVGRRRLWRAAEAPTPGASDVAGDEDAEAALDWLDRDLARHTAQQYEGWLDARPGWPLAWREAAGQQDAPLLVTPTQLAACQDEIGQVLARYRRIGQGNPTARRVAAYLITLPLDLDRTPDARGSSRLRAPNPPG